MIRCRAALDAAHDKATRTKRGNRDKRTTERVADACFKPAID